MAPVSGHSNASSKEWTITETRNLTPTSSNKLSQLSGKFQNYYHKNYRFSYYLFYRLFPKKVELQALMKYYDIDGDGNISYEEFIRGLRDELTERRRKMVEKAFNMLDRDGSGQINI